ncbi:MAG: T9SS type A sorting domain-containing protein, partial [Bacteroidales bacterium]
INELDAESKFNIKVFPNPSSDIITINIEGTMPKKSSFFVYNIVGEKVINIENIETNSFTIRKKNLSDGVYFYELKPSTGNSIKGKLLIN